MPEIGERTALDDPARPDDRDPVGERLDLGEDVAREEHGAPLLLRLPDALLEDGLHERVETRRGFIEEEELDVRGERGDERDLLPVALRIRPPLLPGIEVETLDELVAPALVDPAARREKRSIASPPVRPGQSSTSPGT